MLVKADAGFLGHTGGVGIQGPEKIADLLLDLRTAQWRDRWLDLTVHFRLYPTRPGQNLACPSKISAK
jgi:hypothetical protein